jgi:sodium-dependent dicarboxylate transporter 2/3/5
MLGIAYAASIGGIGTPIGTPPNIAFFGQYAALFPEAKPVTFAQWMLLGVPLALVFLIGAWLVLTRLTCRVRRTGLADVRRALRERRADLGPLSRSEKLVGVIFLATALLWATRSIPISGHRDLGWAAALERGLDAVWGPTWFQAHYLNDATVALGMALLLFLLPGDRRPGTPATALMDWETARRLPWDVLLLFGGGFALAAGLQQSGLDRWCSAQLAGLGIQSPWLLVPAICLLVTLLSEVASNTATAQIMLPIMAQLSSATGTHPLLLMIPATLAASNGFMLPVATPPNAIAFASGYVRMGDMVRSGLVLNLLGTGLITLAVLGLAKPLFGIVTY